MATQPKEAERAARDEPFDLEEYVTASRAAQGLAPRVTDPVVLQRVAELVGRRQEVPRAS